MMQKSTTGVLKSLQLESVKIFVSGKLLKNLNKNGAVRQI